MISMDAMARVIFRMSRRGSHDYGEDYSHEETLDMVELGDRLSAACAAASKRHESAGRGVSMRKWARLSSAFWELSEEARALIDHVEERREAGG